MTRLRAAIDKAKFAYELDVEQQNMEIANLKDTLLEARRASKGQERYTEQLEVVREEESTRSMMKREQDLGCLEFFVMKIKLHTKKIFSFFVKLFF